MGADRWPVVMLSSGETKSAKHKLYDIVHGGQLRNIINGQLRAVVCKPILNSPTVIKTMNIFKIVLLQYIHIHTVLVYTVLYNV